MRHRIRVTGVVQGVGFRPFVHRLATDLGLAGHVGNDTDGVFVEVEGPPEVVAVFEARLVRGRAAAGPDRPASRRRRWHRLGRRRVPYRGEPRAGAGPDLRLARRGRVRRLPGRAVRSGRPPLPLPVHQLHQLRPTVHHHASGCPTTGPTRPWPASRCAPAAPGSTTTRPTGASTPSRSPAPACGPRLWFEEPTGRSCDRHRRRPGREPSGAGRRARSWPSRGSAATTWPVTPPRRRRSSELRRRKHRPDKPFAVMVARPGRARRLARIETGGEAQLLDRPRAPDRPAGAAQDPAPLAASVAPGNPLPRACSCPYTPLHHLLFAPVPGAAAAAGAPGAGDDQRQPDRRADLLTRTTTPGAGWVPSPTPGCSTTAPSTSRATTRWSGSTTARSCPIRRSRGYAPLPGPLPFAVAPTLATGGELKNTFCLASGRHAWMSQHIGDMGSLETLAAFERSHPAVRRHVPGPRRSRSPPTPTPATRPGAGPRTTPGRPGRHAGPAPPRPRRRRSWPSTACRPAQRVIGFAFDGTGYGAGRRHLGRRGPRRRLRRRSTGPPTCATSPCPAATPPSASRTGPRSPTCWAAGVAWDAGPRRRSGPPRPPSWRCWNASSSATSTACRPRAWAGSSTPSARCSDLRHIVTYEAQAAIELEVAARPQLRTVPGRTRFAVDGTGEIDPGPGAAQAIVGRRAPRASAVGGDRARASTSPWPT